MATSSIVKDVRIKNKKLANKFISALENTYENQRPSVELQRPYVEVKTEDIKKMFGENK